MGYAVLILGDEPANRQRLIGFAGAVGETNPEERVGELLRVARGTHPEGVLVLLDEVLPNPDDWRAVDSYIEGFCGRYPNVRYLMVIGGHEVVPFCVVSDPTKEEENISGDHFYSEVTGDRWPDLATGRIIGKNIETMINLIRRYDPSFYSTSESALVSCGDDATEDTCDKIVGYLRSAGFKDILYFRDSNWARIYKANIENKALIVHCGHGSPFSFSTLVDGEEYNFTWRDLEDVGLGYTQPTVLSGGCHTALIEEGIHSYKRKGEKTRDNFPVENFANTISAKFIEMGTSAFMGPTRLSHVGRCRLCLWSAQAYAELLQERFIKHLAEDCDVGTALRMAKEEYQPWWWRPLDSKTVWEHILYGDPKFNPIFPSEAKSSEEISTVGSILEFSVEIPEYSHERQAGYDLITIPGFELTFDEGYPVIPVQLKRFKLERGQTLAYVKLLESKAEKLPEKLNLITTQTASGRVSVEVRYPLVGFYPGTTHRVRVTNNLDGTKTVLVLIAPLQYNPSTGEAYLYRSMRFEISSEPQVLETSPSFLEALLEPGEKTKQVLVVKNVSEAEIPEVNLAGTGSVVGLLSFAPDKLLGLKAGESREVMVTIAAPENLPVGSYEGTLQLQFDGGVLDIPVAVGIQVPVPDIGIEKVFHPGEKIRAERRGAIMPRITVANMGKEEICYLEISDKIPENWELKNVKAISASYFVENEEYGIAQKSLKVSLADGRLRIDLDFKQGIEISNGNGSKIIYSFKPGEEIVLKYPLHPAGKIEPGVYETSVRVRAVGMRRGEATVEKEAICEVRGK